MPHLLFAFKYNSGGIPFVAVPKMQVFGYIIVLLHSYSWFPSKNMITFHLSFHRKQVCKCLVTLFITGSVTVIVFNVLVLTLAAELLHDSILFNNSLRVLHHYVYVRKILPGSCPSAWGKSPFPIFKRFTQLMAYNMKLLMLQHFFVQLLPLSAHQYFLVFFMKW